MTKRKVTVGGSGNVTPPFENVIKAAQISERQGYDAIWYFDHLMSWWPQSVWSPDLVPAARLQTSPHVYFDVGPLMGAVACNTQRVALGTSVTDAIRRPPAVLAQEFLTLDHISKGRAILGIGAGEDCNCGPYGIPRTKPISKLGEAIKIIRLLWSTDQPVDFDGQFWKLRGAVLGLRPYQGHYPPIWIGGAAERTLQIVGETADGWLPVHQPLPLYVQRMEKIRQVAQRNGRDPDAIDYGMFTYIIVDESHEACHRMLDTIMIRDLCLALPGEDFERHGCHHPIGESASGFNDYLPSRVDREQVLALVRQVPFSLVHEFVMHGTPEDVAAHCRPFVEAGASHFALQNVAFAADPDKLGSSFRLMAEVMKLLHGLS